MCDRMMILHAWRRGHVGESCVVEKGRTDVRGLCPCEHKEGVGHPQTDHKVERNRVLF